jgi:hypothetical protein
MVSNKNEYERELIPEMEVYYRVASFIARKGLTIPAVFLLEAHKPLNFIASQFLVFLGPMIYIIFPSADEAYSKFSRSLEKRENVDILIRCIEDEEKKLQKRVKELKMKNQNSIEKSKEK